MVINSIYFRTSGSSINGVRILGGLLDFGVSDANIQNKVLRLMAVLISNIKITNLNQDGTINNPYIIDET